MEKAPNRGRRWGEGAGKGRSRVGTAACVRGWVAQICPPVVTRPHSSLPLAGPALPAPPPPPKAELMTHSSPGLLVASSCGRSQKFLSCFSFPCPTPTDFPA